MNCLPKEVCPLTLILNYCTAQLGRTGFLEFTNKLISSKWYKKILLKTLLKLNYTMNSKLLQEYLLELSLKEVGITGNIKIDHKSGLNFVNGVKLDLKYPLSYINNINMLSTIKVYDYCFVGYFGKLGRNKILEKFKTANSIIIDTDNGRNTLLKYNFDFEYYKLLSCSKFSLCPNHIGEWYNHDYGWTYRYIESLFCKSIPIVFRETPLGKFFLKDTTYFYDDDNYDIGDDEYRNIVEDNYKKAINYWTVQGKEVLLIQS